MSQFPENNEPRPEPPRSVAEGGAEGGEQKIETVLVLDPGSSYIPGELTPAQLETVMRESQIDLPPVPDQNPGSQSNAGGDSDTSQQFDPERFNADDPSTWAKPAGVTWGDHMGPDPARPLSPRHKELARLLALGARNNDIARVMDMDIGRISVLRSNAAIVREVSRLQERVFEESVDKRLKNLGTPAVDVLEGILLDESGQTKQQLKAETARWILEKLTGKARQEIDIGTQTLGGFFALLEEMKNRGESIDVTPTLSVPAQPVSEASGSDAGEQTAKPIQAQTDKWSDWTKDNT